MAQQEEQYIQERPRKHHRILAWICVIAWACFIYYMSSRSGDVLDSGSGIVGMVKHYLNAIQLRVFGPGVDVVSPIAHFCEYAIFGALLAWALGGKGCFVIVIAVVIASAYGVTDEFHQYFVPGRMSDPVDWVVDTAGALCGVMFYSLVSRR